MTNVQPFYYVIESAEDLKAKIQEYATGFYRPFNLKYNSELNNYEVDRSVYLVLPEAKDLSGRPPVHLGDMDNVHGVTLKASRQEGHKHTNNHDDQNERYELKHPEGEHKRGKK